METLRPTIVFAPGAWHSSECFYPVVERLHARGWSTESVSYPSYGAEPPNKTLIDDVASVRTTLEQLINQGREIVLVAHSYGGLVAANATEGLAKEHQAKVGRKGGVIMLVYLAAFVVPKGKGMADMFGGQLPSWINGNNCIPQNPVELFYHDVGEKDLKQAISQLKHTSAIAYHTEALYEPWQDMPCLYFFCEQDRTIPIATQKAFAASLGTDAFEFTCSASHSPFLSMPDKVVEGLEYAARVARQEQGSN
ncbi:Alpha/beta hydrolase fold-1 [Boeremia exigua]|uniref:Alpha/beta hydrolase fold-1 n=1 Tax=Boeremia exigua TaxID=749465 RepID=UPI001E8E7B49|nr:Alpha/beta hydrolase fold-1 [Boeremia exigua]KAH6613162.1 Alpha/beta hydrolase fold-1 [Boeremia exigua]